MTCSHVRIGKQPLPGVPSPGTFVYCKDCGHCWAEYSIRIPDTVYDATLAIMAQRLDNK